MKVLTLLEAVTDALRTEMASDRSVIVFGEDVGVEGGVFRATNGLQRDFGEERCFDTPIAESGIVGAALGILLGFGIRAEIVIGRERVGCDTEIADPRVVGQDDVHGRQLVS